MKLFGLCLLIMCFATGCATTANVTNFPASSSEIDFDEISTRNLDPDDPIWNLKGSSEYTIFLEAEKEKALFNSLVIATQNEGYSVSESNMEKNRLISNRGMRMNEWNSISGIYYRELDEKGKYQVYIRVDITQDITGGWKENRAKQIADEICNINGKCS